LQNKHSYKELQFTHIGMSHQIC